MAPEELHFDSNRVHAVLNSMERFDANESAFIARELTYLRSRVFERKYGEFLGRTLVPVDNSPPNGAESVNFKFSDHVGSAEIVHSDAEDLPSVARAMTARRAVEQKIDQIAILGDSQANLPGLASNSSVSTVAVVTGTWSTATRAQIKEDIEKLVNTTVERMEGAQFGNLTVALPLSQFNILNDKELGSGSDKTLLRTLLENNQYIDSFVPVPRLATAGAGSATRMIAYPRTPEVLQLVIPQEFEMLPPQAAGLSFKVPCHARIAGVEIRYPIAMSYMDGI